MTEASALTDAEVEAHRAATPGAQEVTHLNHAGSSLPAQVVLDTQFEHLTLEAHTGGYEAATEVSSAIEQTYASIGQLIGARPHEISRAEHATSAWNMAFWSVPMTEGQRVVTAEAAYGANAVAFLRAKERYGIEIVVLPSDNSGQVDLEALDLALDHDVALVAITHVPTNGGLVNPAAEIGKRTRAAGVPFLLDACQSVGQMVVDIDEIGCDMLSVTGRKFLRGPRGSGFLYASESILPRLITDHPDHYGATWSAPERYDLLSDSQRFENFEYNVAAWLGLGSAVDLALRIGIGRIESTVQQRSIELRSALTDAGFPVYDLGSTPSGIVTTSCADMDPADVKAELRAQQINTSVAPPNSTLWDATRRGLPPLLRLSVHYITTPDEIGRAVDALVRIRDRAA